MDAALTNAPSSPDGRDEPAKWRLGPASCFHGGAEHLGLHREAQRQRRVDGRDRGEHLDRVAHAGALPTIGHRQHQPVQPCFADRVDAGRAEIVRRAGQLPEPFGRVFGSRRDVGRQVGRRRKPHRRHCIGATIATVFRHTRTLLLISLVFALLAAACGSEPPAVPSGSARASGAVAGATPRPSGSGGPGASPRSSPTQPTVSGFWTAAARALSRSGRLRVVMKGSGTRELRYEPKASGVVADGSLSSACARSPGSARCSCCRTRCRPC